MVHSFFLDKPLTMVGSFDPFVMHNAQTWSEGIKAYKAEKSRFRLTSACQGLVYRFAGPRRM